MRFLLVILWCAAQVISSSAQPRLLLPTPSGPYAVGRTLFQWQDPSRNRRPLQVVVWYPAPKTVGAAASYYPNHLALEKEPGSRAALQNIFGTTLAILTEGRIVTHASENAPVLPGKFPLLLFSPGLGLSPFLYTTQLEDLASRGYLVAAVSHPGDTASYLLSSGQLVAFSERYWAEHPPDSRNVYAYEQHAIECAEDLLFVAKKIKASKLGIAMDSDRIGAFGHSQGGRIAAAACQLNSHIQACLNEDGRLDRSADWRPFWPISRKRYLGSFAMLDWFDPGLSAEDYSAMHTTDHAYALAWLKVGASALDVYHAVQGESFRISLLQEGMSHTSFTDLRFLLAATDTARLNATKDVHAITLVVAAYFDRELRGTPNGVLECTDRQSTLVVQCFHQAKQKPRR